MSMEMARYNPNSIGPAAYFELKLNYEMGPMQLRDTQRITPELQILDVRTQDAFQRGHIPGAINLPFEPLERQQGLQYLYHLNKNLPVVVYSYGLYCTLADQAAFLLAKNGYKVRTLIGGWEGWNHYSLPVEPDRASNLDDFSLFDERTVDADV